MTDSHDDRQLRILNSEYKRFSECKINEIERLSSIAIVEELNFGKVSAASTDVPEIIN